MFLFVVSTFRSHPDNVTVQLLLATFATSSYYIINILFRSSYKCFAKLTFNSSPVLNEQSLNNKQEVERDSFPCNVAVLIVSFVIRSVL
jgi:hypothetical protein